MYSLEKLAKGICYYAGSDSPYECQTGVDYPLSFFDIMYAVVQLLVFLSPSLRFFC
jgi:hypothetical protein